MYKDKLQRLGKEMGELSKAMPEEMQDFMTLHDRALEDGALSPKAKELIALGISIVIRCQGCIYSHVQALIELGCTREELVDCLKVALFMGGGPSTCYGAEALACYDELTADQK